MIPLPISRRGGVVIPLLAGIMFVAVIIAMTMPIAGVPMSQAIISGLAANVCLLAVRGGGEAMAGKCELWLVWTTAKKYLPK